MIEVKLSDKNITVEFPDGTPEDVMRNAIQAEFYGQKSLDQGEFGPDPGSPGLLKMMGHGTAHGVLGLAESAVTGLRYMGAKTGSETMRDLGKTSEEFWGKKREKFEPPESLEGSIIEEPGLMAKPAWWAYQVADILPSFAASIIPGVAGAKYVSILGQSLKLTPQLITRLAQLSGAGIGGVAGGALEGTNTYQEVIRRGGTEEDAAEAGELMTAGSAALNAISVGKALSPNVAGKVINYLKTGVVESVTEYAEEPLEGFILDESWPEIAERLKQGANVIPPSLVLGIGGGVVAQKSSGKPLVAKAEDGTFFEPSGRPFKTEGAAKRKASILEREDIRTEAVEVENGWALKEIAGPEKTETALEETKTSVKEPWEMTKGEIASQPDVIGLSKYDAQQRKQKAIDNHYYTVKKALSEGKPVSKEVLAEYPDLETKEPWQMTEEQYAGKRPSNIAESAQRPWKIKLVEHRDAVKQALSEGKPVPTEVLEPYKEEKWAETALRSEEKELGESVNEVIGDFSRQSGAIDLTAKAPEPAVYQFENVETEERFKTAQGAPKDRFWERLKGTVRILKNKATREYEHLARTGEYAQLRFDLLRLAKQKGVASFRTLEDIRGITIKLDKHKKDLFTRKVILDDLAETAKEDKGLPFGFTKESLLAEKTRLDEHLKDQPEVLEALEKRKRIWAVMKKNYVTAMKAIGFDVSKRLIRENYFRHQVLEYANLKGLFGTGQRLKTPAGRSHLKERKGSELDINTDYIEAENEVMAQILYDIEVAKTIANIDENYNLADTLKAEAKKINKKGNQMITWQDLMPDNYTVWQPRQGNVFYLADSIPARLAEELTSGALKELGVVPDQLRQVLAVGSKRREFVIKNEIAATLDNLLTQRSKNVIAEGHKSIITKWKIWQLISPRRYFRFNIRNLTGDSDAVFAGNPAVFKKVPKAVQELYNVFFRDKAMTGNYRDWFERGGVGTTLQAQEMGEFNELRMFKRFLGKNRKKAFTDIPLEVWKKYWKTARLTTDFRESVLRYAAYLEYLEQMKADPNGKPKGFAASKPEEIMALKDIKDRAFWMANDLLGAYDRIGVFGQTMREHIFPFWSWKEVNFRRYAQLFRNAANDNNLCRTVGRTVAGRLIKSPFTAIRVGKFMIKASAFWAMLQVWNHTMFPDEEDDLPKTVRDRPHIILGRDNKGNVEYFSRLGALPDLLEWFGLDTAPQYIDAWAKGKMGLKDIGREMAKAPINVLAQGAEPVAKTAMELITRRALFPDVFQPRTIRDRYLHVARSMGLENEYLAMSDKPSRPYRESIQAMFAYKIDPLAAAYQDIMAEKQRFMRSIGKYGEGFWITPTGTALYNIRLALKYKDRPAFEKSFLEYTIKYVQAGGDPLKVEQNVKDSLTRMDPLAGMTKTEQDQFALQLNEDDRKQLVRAFKFYGELLAVEEDMMEMLAKNLIRKWQKTK